MKHTAPVPAEAALRHGCVGLGVDANFMTNCAVGGKKGGSSVLMFDSMVAG